MANVGSKGIVRYEETFAADNVAGGAAGSDGTVADGIAWLGSSDTGNTPFVRAMNTARGLHVAGATDATGATDMIEFNGDQLMFYGQTGHSSAEIMVQFDDVTNMAFNFGFNDEVTDSSNLTPVSLSGTTWTSNAGAFVGFVYDTDAGNDELHCFWVNGDVDTTTAIADLRMNGLAPTNSKWLYMKVEIQDRGSGNGVRATLMCADHNGRSAEKVFNTTVARTTALCFYFCMANRSASAHNCYIKCPAWEQTIETN